MTADEAVLLGLACSRFNEPMTERLLKGARAALVRHGLAEPAVTVAWVPGAFELPLAAARLADRNHAVVALGAVIRGETDHHHHIATQCAAGLQRVALDRRVPVVFGVLTTDTAEQALERSGGERGNKGEEAVEAALEMVDLVRRLSGTA